MMSRFEQVETLKVQLQKEKVGLDLHIADEFLYVVLRLCWEAWEFVNAGDVEHLVIPTAHRARDATIAVFFVFIDIAGPLYAFDLKVFRVM